MKCRLRAAIAHAAFLVHPALLRFCTDPPTILHRSAYDLNKISRGACRPAFSRRIHAPRPASRPVTGVGQDMPSLKRNRMSLKWTKQIWASTALSHPTDRLMLLALAEHADDEGLCWPSVETLQRRCSLKTRRGARKVLERLDQGGFIERIERPGRSNVYRIKPDRLGTPERQDRDVLPPTPEHANRGREKHQGRGGGTPGPGREERRDRVSRNANAVVEPSNSNSSLMHVVASDKRRLVDLLTARGVHTPEARRLVRRYKAERIGIQIKHFDYLCSIGKSPYSGGWLPVAIRREYPLPPPLAQRLRRPSSPLRIVAPAPRRDDPPDSKRSARPETIRMAVASAIEQLEKNKPPDRASPRTGQKRRRPWWAQEPIPPHIIEEIETQRASFLAEVRSNSAS